MSEVETKVEYVLQCNGVDVTSGCVDLEYVKRWLKNFKETSKFRKRSPREKLRIVKRTTTDEVVE